LKIRLERVETRPLVKNKVKVYLMKGK